ncbi:MAG TPA: hypothetical protein VGW38_15290 [Chloroflexota bacterium]|nr:hypothetical protein [Chloroflexota bacterium]
MVQEDLNIEQPKALVAYLRATGRIAPGEHPRVTRLTGGVSNRTVLVERTSGEAWVLKQALTKLRVPVAWYSNTPACLMARVAERSELEYLDAAARRRQGRAAGALMGAARITSTNSSIVLSGNCSCMSVLRARVAGRALFWETTCSAASG